MGDIIFVLIIFWDMGKDLILVVVVEVIVFIGKYDVEWLVNISNNFYIYKLLFFFIWLFIECIELLLKVIYSFNMENYDIDYCLGQIFYFDYFVSYWVIDNLCFGLNGYYFKQIIDDKQNGEIVWVFGFGEEVDDGVCGQVFVIGLVVYLIFFKYVSVEICWVKEFDVENCFEGDMFWVKLIILFEF